MVLLHGGSHTGFCYLSTLDGRPGWAYDFVRHGHRVVVADWPGSGRSGYIANDDITAEMVCAGLAAVIEAQPEPVILMTHSMSGQFGWKLLEMLPGRIALVVGVAPGPPGNVQPEPIVLRESPAELQLKRTPTSTNTTIVLGRPFVPDRAFVEFKLIGPSTQFPRDLTDRYHASLIPVPTPLLLRRMNYRGSALRIDDVAKIRDKRIVVVHGTDDPDHPREFEGRMCAWLVENGALCEHYDLGDYGITGNGHMLMLERNSSAVADFIMSKIHP
jgi:pimeloyl-ACP methyl ester carboxylesterase